MEESCLPFFQVVMTDSLLSDWGGGFWASRDCVWVYSSSQVLGQPCYSFPFTTHAHLCGSTSLETLLWAVNAVDIKLQKVIFTLRIEQKACGFLSIWLAGGM